MSFHYLIDRIKHAEFSNDPFRHIYIEDFFNADDFRQIVEAREIDILNADSDENLFNALSYHGYEIIDFPGCTQDKDVYLAWRRDRNEHQNRYNTACEGFGVTLRLMRPQSDVLTKLSDFMSSQAFQTTLAEKFEIPLASVYYDCGIQKYLDGYEISPHPDIRKKALTYMVNINPSEESESEDHHTHYLSLRPQYKYVQAYWEGNPGRDRSWLPWDWCQTEKTQAKNNSIVIFAPANDTLHAVKASYDHLRYQRTQLYGNLWRNETSAKNDLKWEDFVIAPSEPPPARVKPAIRSALNAVGLGGVGRLVKRRLSSVRP